MKLAISPQQYFSLDGKVLVAGRLSVHLHDTDVLATVYTLEGPDYVQGQNPVVLDDAGEVHATVWVDEGYYDVDVEQRNEDGSFVKISEFQFGFQLPDAKNDTIVYGIEGLHDANPELGTVSVYGFNENCVAPLRQYIWDPDCTQHADDGVLVASDHSDTGRWCLLWADEKLPCTVYGIVPGHEENMDAFFGYPSMISKWNIATPPVARFLSGTYTTTAQYSTTKVLYFDAGAKFNTTLECPSAIVEQGDSYVADFVFHHQDFAMASWFRTARGFLTCGASTLRYGLVDYMVDRSIKTFVKISNTTIEGARRLALTYSNGAYLWLDTCAISGSRLFNPATDVIKFSSTTWDQEWFTNRNPAQYDFGMVVEGHRLEYLSIGGNDMSLGLFPVTELYVMAWTADEQKRVTPTRVLRLAGRTLSSLTSTAVAELHDCTVTGQLYLTSSLSTTGRQDIRLQNVKVTGHARLEAPNVFLTDSSVIFDTNPGDINQLTCRDSSVSKLGTAWTRDTTFAVNGGYWNMYVRVADDDTTNTKTAAFNGTHFYDAELVHKHLVLRDCELVNCTLKVYPYLDGSTYRTAFSATGCTFDITNPITFDKHASDDSYDRVHDVHPSVIMLGNSFMHEGLGVWIRFWSNITNHTTYLVNGTTDATVFYRDNVGFCPQDSFRGFYGSFSEKAMYWPLYGSPYNDIYVSYNTVRAVPACNLLGLRTNPYYLGDDGQVPTTNSEADGQPGAYDFEFKGLGQFVCNAQLSDTVNSGADNWYHSTDNDWCVFRCAYKAGETPASNTLSVQS